MRNYNYITMLQVTYASIVLIITLHIFWAYCQNIKNIMQDENMHIAGRMWSKTKVTKQDKIQYVNSNKGVNDNRWKSLTCMEDNLGHS